MFKVKSLATLTVITLILTGCNSTQIENADEVFTDNRFLVEIPDATIMPSKAELQGTRIKVVVLDTKINSDADFEKGAVREVSSKIENGLINAGVEIVDRSLAGKLSDEISVFEATGRFSGAGLSVADIAILPSVSNVQISSGYTPSNNYTKDGKSYTNPATCNYSSQMRGNAKLYKLPDLQLIEGVVIEGDYSSSGPVTSRSCNISSTMASGLAANAAEDAINESINQIQKHMSGQSYVVEYRKMDGKHFALITMGSSSGLKTGQKIQFAKQAERYSRLEDKTTVVEVPYSFEGVVSNIVRDNTAWIIVDEEAENKLHFGDLAKKLFDEQSIFDKLKQKVNL